MSAKCHIHVTYSASEQRGWGFDKFSRGCEPQEAKRALKKIGFEGLREKMLSRVTE